jgi:hypothetical protein
LRLAPERICVSSAEIGLALTGIGELLAVANAGTGGGAGAPLDVGAGLLPSADSSEKSTVASVPSIVGLFMLSPSCAIICERESVCVCVCVSQYHLVQRQQHIVEHMHPIPCYSLLVGCTLYGAFAKSFVETLPDPQTISHQPVGANTAISNHVAQQHWPR